MPRSKPRKKHNPQRLKNRFYRHRAERCLLYRWLSMNEGPMAYVAAGPHDQDLNEKYMTWALGQSERWFISTIACFITETGEYYEEEAVAGPIGPLIVGNNPPVFSDLLIQLLQDVTHSGNPKHYVDTAITLTLYCEKAVQQHEDDAWCKRQSAKRANALLAQWEKDNAVQLPAQNEPAA